MAVLKDFTPRLAIKGAHSWLGLASGAFITVLLVTGVMLNHPLRWIAGSDRERLSLAADPSNKERLYRGTRSALERSEDGGRNWDEVPMLLPAEEVVSIVFSPRDARHIYVLQRWMGVLESTDGGVVWGNVPLDFDPQAADVELKALSVSSAGDLYLETSAGLLNRSIGGDWRPVDFDLKRRNWSRVVRGLHTGHFFGPWFVKVYDATSAVLLILIISGVVLWRIKSR